MRYFPLILSSASVVALTCVISAAAYYYKSRSDKNKEINEVMVFCKLRFNPNDCFDKFMSYIETAKESVDVCMPSIQNAAIQGRLLQLITEKQIKVQIIIDQSGWNNTTDFLLQELIDAGAVIKSRVNGPYNIHHKFCLVDNRILMTGTLNWGNDRSCDNWNYVYITSKPQLVDPVIQEFQKLWTTFVDIKTILVSEKQDNEDVDVNLDDEEERDELSSPNDLLAFEELRATPEVCINMM